MKRRPLVLLLGELAPVLALSGSLALGCCVAVLANSPDLGGVLAALGLLSFFATREGSR